MHFKIGDRAKFLLCTKKNGAIWRSDGYLAIFAAKMNGLLKYMYLRGCSHRDIVKDIALNGKLEAM